MILTPLQKLLKNVEDLGKLIVAKDLKKLPKVQKIAQSGHTGGDGHFGRKNRNKIGPKLDINKKSFCSKKKEMC